MWKEARKAGPETPIGARARPLGVLGLHRGVTVGRQEGDQRKTWQLSMAGSSSPRRVPAPQSNFIPDLR